MLRKILGSKKFSKITAANGVRGNFFARSAERFSFHFSQKCAFTLAEVLITLAVIGVVAALTMPTLVQSYKKSVVETRLAKFYSVMNNAIRMAEVEYGPQNTWTDYAEDNENGDDGEVLFEKGEKYDVLMNKYFAPYLKITGSNEIRDVAENFLPQKVYYLADGSAFSFNLHENREITFYPLGNPEKYLKNPNTAGSGQFAFVFIPVSDKFIKAHASLKWEYKYNFGNGMQPDLYNWDGNEDSLMDDTRFGCKSDSGVFCTEVIRHNGWKIPKDYPKSF